MSRITFQLPNVDVMLSLAQQSIKPALLVLSSDECESVGYAIAVKVSDHKNTRKDISVRRITRASLGALTVASPYAIIAPPCHQRRCACHRISDGVPFSSETHMNATGKTPLNVDANADETNEPVLAAAAATAFMYAVDGFDQSFVLLQAGGAYTLRLPNTLANVSAMALTYWFVQTVHGKRNTKCVRRYRLAHALIADAIAIPPAPAAHDRSESSLPLMTSVSRATSTDYSSPRSCFSLDGVDADDDSADFLSANDTGSDDNGLLPSEHRRTRKRRFSSVDISNTDQVCAAPSNHRRRTLTHSQWKYADLDDNLTANDASTTSWDESYFAELSSYDSDIPSLKMTSEDLNDVAIPTDDFLDETTVDSGVVPTARVSDGGVCICRPTMFEVSMAMSDSNTVTDTRVVELLSNEYRATLPECITLRCAELKSKTLVIFQVNKHGDAAHIEFAVPRWRDLNADAQRAFTSLSQLVAPLQGTTTFRLSVAVQSQDAQLCEFVLNIVLRTNRTDDPSRISSAIETRLDRRESDDQVNAADDSVLVQMEIRIPRACLSALPSLNTSLAYLVRSYTDKCRNQTASDENNVESAALRWFVSSLTETQSIQVDSSLLNNSDVSSLHIAVAIGDVISCRHICNALNIDPTNSAHSVSPYELLIIRQRQCSMATLTELQDEWTMDYVYTAIARLFAEPDEMAVSLAVELPCGNTIKSLCHVDKTQSACLNSESHASLDDPIAFSSKSASLSSFEDFLFADESSRIASELSELRIAEDELVSASAVAIDEVAKSEECIGEQSSGAFDLQTTELDSVWPLYTSAFQCRSEHDILNVTLISPAHAQLIIDSRTPALVTGRVRMMWSRQPLRLAALTRRHPRQLVDQLRLVTLVKRDALQHIQAQIDDVRSKQFALRQHAMLIAQQQTIELPVNPVNDQSAALRGCVQ